MFFYMGGLEWWIFFAFIYSDANIIIVMAIDDEMMQFCDMNDKYNMNNEISILLYKF